MRGVAAMAEAVMDAVGEEVPLLELRLLQPRRELRPLDLHAEMLSASRGHQVERAARCAGGVDQLKTHPREVVGDEPLRVVSQCPHGQDRSAGLTPAQPEPEYGVVEPVSTIRIAHHRVAEPLEISDGRSRGRSDGGCHVGETRGTRGDGEQRRDEPCGPPHDALQLVLEVQGEAPCP